MRGDLEAVLGPEGLLARTIQGFAHRPQQLAMAQAVAETLDEGGVLLAEAGTGTGKTFAYLVPALLSGRKVIVSTGTRNLQDQLFHRDLPRLLEAMGSPARTALLKGRANYLCLHRLDLALEDTHPRELLDQLHLVRQWAAHTQAGDIAELTRLPEEAPVWPRVTSTVDNCLGSECPRIGQCHLVEARRKAQEADLVVVNHHLLCADLALKEQGFGELLPAADALVVDEAHQLPETAGNFFGQSVGTRQLLDLCRDARLAYHREIGDQPALEKRIDQTEKAARDFRLAFEGQGERGGWEEIAERPQVRAALAFLEESLGALEAALAEMEGRGQETDQCRLRAQNMRQQLGLVCRAGEDDGQVRWYQVHPQSVRVTATPLEIADTFRERLESHGSAWIFTSATLAVGDDFSHFARQLGIDPDDARTGLWESPFDYARQALWLVPRGLPRPADPDYTERVMELALPLLEASRGRAFLLFTSHRALRRAAAWLEARGDFELLVQGTAPRAELLERFVEKERAVLLGTASFWEGVDVRGEALSLVIIDKLPFASPADPVLRARLDAIRRRGGNPFKDFQLPQAVIALKQGAGRLIRDPNDRGVLVVCDPRLLRNNYGHTFLAAMPPFARTRDPAEAVAFLKDL